MALSQDINKVTNAIGSNAAPASTAPPASKPAKPPKRVLPKPNTKPSPLRSNVKSSDPYPPRNMTFGTVTDRRTQDEATDDSILHKYWEALIMSGADTPDDANYLRAYNSLHRMDYFNPHVANGVHIFMTRPFCAFTPNNLGLDNTIDLAATSLEGCLLLASLMPPYGKWIMPVEGPGDISVKALLSKYDPSYGEAAFNNIEKYGLNVLRGTPFIPIVSNLANSISGMQDFIIEKYDYDGDQAGNKTSDAKGMDESSSSGQVTLGFDESSNLDVSFMHYLWMKYMDKTGKGILTPCQSSLINLWYDYMASIYWFVTGQDGYSIKIYGKLTGVFPINLPITSLVPSQRGTPADSKMSITYHYNHAELMDPEIIHDFNSTIDMMKREKPAMRLENDIIGFNTALETFKEQNFKLTWENISKDRNAANKNAKYDRFMASGKDGNNQDTFDGGVFTPGVQNMWLGHPYIESGKLVYRSY